MSKQKTRENSNNNENSRVVGDIICCFIGLLSFG